MRKVSGDAKSTEDEEGFIRDAALGGVQKRRQRRAHLRMFRVRYHAVEKSSRERALLYSMFAARIWQRRPRGHVCCYGVARADL